MIWFFLQQTINIYMKHSEANKGEVLTSSPDSKKKEHKSKKLATLKMKNDSSSCIEKDGEVRNAICNLIQNTVAKYSNMAENQLKDTRDDFESLQAIISEFLEDYIIIGHTLDGQRVVIRYTPTPADLDGLTELCKKVLVRMMIQEQSGQ